jgi:lipoprotein-anchoring transpeptidase ErfK/SrfK
MPRIDGNPLPPNYEHGIKMISRRWLLTGAASLLTVSPSNAGFLFFKSEKEMAEERAKNLGELKALRKKAKLAKATKKKSKQLTESELASLAKLEKLEPKLLAAEKAAKAKLKANEKLAAAKKLKVEEKKADVALFSKKQAPEDELVTEITPKEVARLDAQARKKKIASQPVEVAQIKKPTKKTWTIDPKFEPQTVSYSGGAPGSIVIDTQQKFLYLVDSSFSARRYGVAVGKDGLDFHGTVIVGRKAEWPRWIPTPEMIERSPEKYAKYADGMDGGPENPLGARAIYLNDPVSGKDTYLRIHGTTQPWTIGTAASNGCFRMVNEHVMELFNNVPVGTKVVVL